MRKQRVDGIVLVFVIILVTTVFVTICSKCSPIYPLNNWDDANCFFTVGKSIANGSVLYRDIFEQKGPLLYFVYVIAYWISANTFLGAYFIEIAFGVIFLFFAWKTMRLYIGDKALCIIPILALLVYGIRAFQMGGSSEELCLPWVMYSAYTGISAIKNQTIIRKRSWFFIGLAMGFIFWVKFSLIGFFIGMAVFFAIYYIKLHRAKEIIIAVLFIIIGVISISLPVVIYCLITNSFSDLLDVYFYTNLFAYTKADHSNPILSKMISLFMGALSMMKNNTLCLPLMICTLVYFFKTSKQIAWMLLIEFFCSFVLIYIGGRRFAYYSLILCAFIPFGLIVVYKILKKQTFLRIPAKLPTVFLVIVICVICGSISFFVSPNTYMIKYKRTDLAQYRFADIISKSQNPTLLNYGFMDGGFYTASGVKPNCRFFCSLNVDNDIIQKEQNKYIKQKKIQYIVTIQKDLSFDGYTFISEAVTENRYGDFVHYYLYEQNAE